jgi:hypothetical protein
MEDLLMAEGKTTLVIEDGERTYILPPHPEAHVVQCEETVVCDKPEVAKETLTALIENAVSVQLQSQVRELRSELREEIHAEVQAEIQNEIRGGLVFNDNGKKLQLD